MNEILVTKKCTKLIHKKREFHSERSWLCLMEYGLSRSIRHCNGPTHTIKDSLIHKDGPSHKGVPNGLDRAWVSPFNLFRTVLNHPSIVVDGDGVKLVRCIWPLTVTLNDLNYSVIVLYEYILVHLFWLNYLNHPSAWMEVGVLYKCCCPDVPLMLTLNDPSLYNVIMHCK